MPDKSQPPVLYAPRFWTRLLNNLARLGAPTPPRKAIPVPAPSADEAEAKPRLRGPLKFKATRKYADGRQKGRMPSVNRPHSRPRSLRRAIASARTKR